MKGELFRERFSGEILAYKGSPNVKSAWGYFIKYGEVQPDNNAAFNFIKYYKPKPKRHAKWVEPKHNDDALPPPQEEPAQNKTIDSKSGNLFKIAPNDRSVNDYPGYKIVKAKGFVPIAKTLKDGKRGNVEEILGYNKTNDQYKVKWDDGSKGYTYVKSIRKGNSTILSRLERMYWEKTGENIPVKIRKYI